MNKARIYGLIVPAAVLTTVSRHIIAALQLEGVLLKGWVWDVFLVALALAFAALEGVALVQIEEAMPCATDEERKRLGRVRMAIYVAIPATFIAPLVAQSMNVTVAALLAGVPVAMWVLAALNVAAPMFVISGSATAMSILRNHEAPPKARKLEPQAERPERVTVRKPATPQLTDALTDAPTEVQPVAQAAISSPQGGVIDRAELAVALAASPQPSSAELAQLFGVSSSAIRATSEWRNRKGEN
jgi:hypothetical protein